MAESFSELLEENLTTVNMVPGTIITGVVAAVDRDRVTVYAGLKSEGIIPRSQFFTEEGEDVKVDDLVKVMLEIVDDGYGETRMSREKARRAEVWEKLEDAFTNNQNIMGTISDKVKGGYTVNIDDVRAFLPGSLVDVRPVRDLGTLEGSPLDFRIIKLDQKRNNVVVSRRSVLEAQNNADLQTLLDSLHEGPVLTGIVKNLTDYGAFVDLGGIDGLLHVTDMSWRRVKHPSEVVSLGEELKVKVLRYDSERDRVSLGIKQLGDNPWLGIAERYPVGSKFKAAITNIMDYGCFAALEEGVEGLIHVSEMAWTSKNIAPAKLVSVGEEVEVMVLAFEEDRHRISLGLKQCQSNPWDLFAQTHEEGESIRGKINSVTDFGIFIELGDSIDGLVHISDIAWDIPGEEAVKKYSKGQEIEVAVLSIDPSRERVGLGIKQLERDPFTEYLADKNKGSVVTGTVKKREMQKVVVALTEEISATMKASEVDVHKRVDDLRAHFEDGEQIEAAISSIDRKNRTIKLSIKARQMIEEAHALESHRQSTQDTQAVGTIGDLIQEQMSKYNDSQENDSQANASQESASQANASQENDSQASDSQESDSQESDSQANDSQKNDSQKN